MRYVCVEVLSRDLWVGGMAILGGGIGGGATSMGGNGEKEGKGVGEWSELCGLWDGVWGLRLGVKGSVLFGRRKMVDVDVDGERENGMTLKWSKPSEEDDSPEKWRHQEKGILNVQMEWVIDGLLRMRSLRWIQLEIEDEDVDLAVKLQFCAELANLLSELRDRDDGWIGDVKVAFVEKIKEVEGQEKWYMGEPDDGDVWMDSS